MKNAQQLTAERLECEPVWEEAFEAFDAGGSSAAIAIIVAAKRKWEKAAANAKLEEAAEAIHYWDTALGDASSAIERLKQE